MYCTLPPKVFIYITPDNSLFETLHQLVPVLWLTNHDFSEFIAVISS